ncbi:hypothetical protein M409DRAFT_51739 [Zasmidium cellare ATCC 36951]|uniref:Zn(2)-C6 fungal-type domain-containing protein n=1 Tax=Zasmidium cellare ATCC 36951 TaxID=1080233 RepID=A0A6A6CS20_ZASCE|nr:uncharacterized protein M409DRAFT_51739 [Zasmidium cellare ATCC 36951]KAF2169954.1 hypothetical protein M409DRAFT_51739 [Zasmidium cellare ATCC 36951]
MYERAPPRRKKTDICDQRKPSCGTCLRLKRSCEPPSPRLEFRYVQPFSSGPRWESTRDRDALTVPHFDVGVETVETICEPPSRTFDDVSASDSKELDADENALLRMPSTLSPHRDSLAAARFYLNVWKAQCLPTLPAELHHLERLAYRSFVIVDMMTALSACRLSRNLPQRRLIRQSASSLGSSFRPDKEHESLGCQHYGAVIHQVARWDNNEFATDPVFGLTFMVMFCLIAASMGSFAEFRLHSNALKNHIQIHASDLIRNGLGLLATWTDVEMQTWWRRAYFSRPNFHRHHGSLSLDPQIEAALITAGKRRATVSVIISESHRLNTAAIVSCRTWEDDDGERDNIPSCPSQVMSMGHYTRLLSLESDKLDAWLASVPLLELPLSTPVPEQTVAQITHGGLFVEPLRFQTHDAAMNFAYYVVARIMQCSAPLMALDTNECSFDLDVDYENTESWVLTLLRIAAGLDWKECVRTNVFTIGLTSLLLAAALQSRSLAVGEWMHNWLEERLTGDAFEEANFPIFQALDILRLINRERTAGWDVLALFQTVDDGGGKGKFGSYHSQAITALWVYGRCRKTEKLCKPRAKDIKWMRSSILPDLCWKPFLVSLASRSLIVPSKLGARERYIF